MIDLTEVRAVLADAQELIDDLDGLDIDDSDAITKQGAPKPRNVKAQASKDLLLLADRLDLAAALARNLGYWRFKGEPHPVFDEVAP